MNDIAAIGREATRLEQRLNMMMDMEDGTFEVLSAAAWELAELDHLLTNGHADHVLWFSLPDEAE